MQSAKKRRYMEKFDELSRRELMALKEICLTGRTNDSLALRLLSEDMIAHIEDGYFQLTSKGRRMLVRGSPLLWENAA
jgi:hypothetical protein